MRNDTGIIKAGMAIVISSGMYSNYSFGQVYIALQDFNYLEEAKKFYMEGLEKKELYYNYYDENNYYISERYSCLISSTDVSLGLPGRQASS